MRLVFLSDLQKKSNLSFLLASNNYNNCCWLITLKCTLTCEVTVLLTLDEQFADMLDLQKCIVSVIPFTL